MADELIVRRSFLARLSALGLVASCTRSAPNGSDTARRGTPNPDSRLDTIHKMQHGPTTSVSGTAAPYQRYDPTLPPLPKERHQTIHWRAQELPVRLTPDLVVAAWTFEGNIPGPIVRCRVGDTIDFTLTNEGAIPHSMDFHAAQIDPKVAFRS